MDNGTLTATGSGGTIDGAGTTDLVITGTQAEINAILATLSYTPNTGFSGADFLTILSQDSSNAYDSDGLAINIPTSFTGPTVSEADLATGSTPSGTGETASTSLTAPSGQSFGTNTQSGTDAYGSWTLTTGGVFTYTLTSAPGVSGASTTRTINVSSYDQFVNVSTNPVTVTILNDSPNAFTAKRYGCRIPTMGIAFLVMWPMAYTDTNETWRLRSRHQRLHVASAGILVELTVAVWAALAWTILPDGTLRSTAFVLATTSWIATLAINASPFMRFDGYYILSDWLDIPNLHERSFALARWRLRETLFDLGEEKPEHFSAAGERALILFAIAVWAYRLALYLGIAVLFYHFFIKAVGIFLFAVEMSWFVILPIARELGGWKQRWPRIREKRRVRLSAFIFLVPVILVFLPWPGSVGSSGLLRPAELWTVYAPGPAKIIRFDLVEGQEVAKGDTLLVMQAPERDAKRAGILAQVERLRWMADAAGFDAASRDRMQSSRNELATAQAELASINEDLARFSPVAPFSGHVRDIAPDIGVGDWVGRNEKLALLVGAGQQVVETYLDEAAVKRIRVGDHGLFMIDAGTGPALELRVANIDADASRVLNTPMLAASAGGRVITRDRNGRSIPEQSVYRVILDVRSPSPDLSDRSWRGRVAIRADWEAPAWRYIHTAVAVLVREFGF